MAGQLKKMAPEDFVAMVNSAFRLSHVDIEYMAKMERGILEEASWRLAMSPPDNMHLPKMVTGVQENSVASFPLRMRHADSYISERVALIGWAFPTNRRSSFRDEIV